MGLSTSAAQSQRSEGPGLEESGPRGYGKQRLLETDVDHFFMCSQADKASPSLAELPGYPELPALWRSSLLERRSECGGSRQRKEPGLNTVGRDQVVGGTGKL